MVLLMKYSTTYSTYREISYNNNCVMCIHECIICSLEVDVILSFRTDDKWFRLQITKGICHTFDSLTTSIRFPWT